jgi:hypothetical protein
VLPAEESRSAAAAPGAAATVRASLSATRGSFTIPLSAGYSATLFLHAPAVPRGTHLLLGVRQPENSTVSVAAAGRAAPAGKSQCPSTFTIPLYNPFPFRILLYVDGLSINLPCNVEGTLFGVSFYQLKPVPATVFSLKVGDVTAKGNSITFTSDVTSITLPADSETAISVAPESSTSEVALPLVPGTNTLLTSNAPSLQSSLALNFSSSGGGGGSLFSSACFPAYVDGQRAPALAGAVLMGTPSLYCQLATVNSPTILFGAPTVTFTVGSPKPDRGFISFDGPSSEFLCAESGTTTCVTPEFTVPTVKNVIAGNIADLQICVPAKNNTDCNSNGNPASPAPAASSVPPNQPLQLLVADDATYVGIPGPCSAPQICGGFSLDTSHGSCVIDNGNDKNGDVPPAPPVYMDPGGPQEDPPVWSGTSNGAVFPAVGPYVEFDLISGADGTTCTVTVTETTGPLLRSSTYTIPVN